MDRRLLRSNGKVAHSSLRGQVEAERFADGQPHVVNSATTDILDAPKGARDRQLLLGARFVVLEDSGTYSFGFAEADGYAGWVLSSLLRADSAPRTHRVRVARSIGLDNRDVKQPGNPEILSLGSLVSVTHVDGAWCNTQVRNAHLGVNKWIRTDHLMPLDQLETDPVAVAERLTGTPYLWGGNSAFGIDCSGLVQIACTACGIPCPGDSDLQQAHFPAASSPDYQRGDLLFWKGHVAWVSDPQTLIHANAHHMAVAYEPIADAIARIKAQGDGPVTHHARLQR